MRTSGRRLHVKVPTREREARAKWRAVSRWGSIHQIRYLMLGRDLQLHFEGGDVTMVNAAHAVQCILRCSYYVRACIYERRS